MSCAQEVRRLGNLATPPGRPLPHSENVAAPNSGRAVRLQLARIRYAASLLYPFCRRRMVSRPRSRLPTLLWTKNEPRCGIDTRARGSGHGYYLLLRKVLFERTENFQAAQRSRTAVRRWRMITVGLCLCLARFFRYLARYGYRHHPWRPSLA